MFKQFTLNPGDRIIALDLNRIISVEDVEDYRSLVYRGVKQGGEDPGTGNAESTGIIHVNESFEQILGWLNG